MKFSELTCRKLSFLLVLFITHFSGIAQTTTKLQATGPQPTVVTPQGRVTRLYEESHALLISASRYRHGWPSLPATAGETDLLAEALRKQGFDIWLVSDPTGFELRAVLRNFFAEYGGRSSSRLFFFFSGHGYTNPNNGFSYLVPVDAKDPRKMLSEFQKVALPIAEVEVVAKELSARHALFIFDSCFSGSIFTTKALLPRQTRREGDPSTRWRFLTGHAAKPVRQFISAGGADEELPAKSVFLPLLVSALEGAASLGGDGYVTGKEIGLWLEQQVPAFNRSQNPQSGVIRVPDFAHGDMVFQYQAKGQDFPMGTSSTLAALPLRQLTQQAPTAGDGRADSHIGSDTGQFPSDFGSYWNSGSPTWDALRSKAGSGESARMTHWTQGCFYCEAEREVSTICWPSVELAVQYGWHRGFIGYNPAQQAWCEPPSWAKRIGSNAVTFRLN